MDEINESILDDVLDNFELFRDALFDKFETLNVSWGLTEEEVVTGESTELSKLASGETVPTEFTDRVSFEYSKK
ncbi:MAG: hypothetical protein EOM41_08145 [Bacilli bacterium]|nr:hypothetical protein [Bacilli bacterium]